jgi:pilus assembly protein CpaF
VVGIQESVRLARRLAVSGGLKPDAAIQSAIDFGIENHSIALESEHQAKQHLQNQLMGFGQLQPLLDDVSIEEIWLNDEQQVFIARAGISESLKIPINTDELRVVIEKMLRPTGRRLDRSSPFVDASLPDGSRLHVAIPDITRRFWSVNIRKFPKRSITLNDLVKFGTVSPRLAAYLRASVIGRKNILVSGATQAGKTTLLTALLNELPSTQRIVSVEETFELKIEQPDWVGMQTRQPNLEGIGEVSLRRLVKEALRMRPDRLIVGEVREAESLDLLIALNSGLPGACTIHANSARDAVAKLCTLPLLAGQNISTDFVNPTVGNCIDVVVHCRLDQFGKRKVEQVLEVSWNQAISEIEFVEVSQNELV